MTEIWKDIKDYEGLYQISNLGRVKSLPRDTNNQFGKKERILNFQTLKTGYKFVVLSKNGITKNKLVHRLVAEAFIPNIENKPQINHKDGNKENNVWTNLEWNTSEENLNHAIKNKLKTYKKGKENAMYGRYSENANRSVKVNQYDLDGNFIKQYNSLRDAGKENNVRPGSVSNACRDKNKTLKGYIWKYVNKGGKDE